jgi:hypothetical protein
LSSSPPIYTASWGVVLQEVLVEDQQQAAERVLYSSVQSPRKEQQVIGLTGEGLHRLVPLALFELGAVLVGRELMGLVDKHEVPMSRGSGLETTLIPGEEIDGRGEDTHLVTGELAWVGIERSPVHEPRIEAELLLDFLFLPLLRQAARCDDENLLEDSTEEQLLDQEPGHDRPARPGVVGEQESDSRKR